MSQPAVTITELDGALGILPASSGRLLALVGVASSGPIDTPATFARVRDVVSTFGSGPLVEAAAYFIKTFGRPCVIVRTGQSNPGAFPAGDSVQFEGTGDSAVTVEDASTSPFDDLEFYFEVVSGGTVGTAGITFRWSIDGGRTLSPVTSLGTDTGFVFPASGGVQVDFAAGTLAAGDKFSFVGTAPQWNGAELTSALGSLFASSINWEICHVVGVVDGTSFDVIDPLFSGAQSSGKYRSWYGSARMPSVGESEADYLAAVSTAFGSKATLFGSLAAGAAKVTSGVSGRVFRRPVAFVVAAFEQSVSEEIDIADVNLGPLQGVAIRDQLGNPDEHDESLYPGLDDARFVTLRTWEGFAGVYVNRPRVFSPAGSDFDLHTKRRVINIAHAVLLSYFTRRLNKPVRVHRDTGFILEQEALEIESGARAALRAALLAKPKASAAEVTLSRTDNLLSTKKLTGTARVTPLAYPEFIELDLGFVNPALQTQAA